MTLADEDTDSIPTGGANKAILGNVAMLMPNFATNANGLWSHPVAQFATYAGGTIQWPNLNMMQVALTVGQIFNYMIQEAPPDDQLCNKCN